MGQLGKLEMNFEFEEKMIELKMTNIDPVIQFKIMELCMQGVHEPEALKQPDPIEEKKEPEAPKVIAKNGQTEDEIKAGYQLFAEPVQVPKEEPIYKNEAPRINTYNMEKSVRLKNGVKHYQLFYICPDCGNKGKHHITPGTPKIKCHKFDCGTDMMVRLATPKGLPNHDEWGNYYIAGEFKMSMKDKEEEAAFLKENDNDLLLKIN